MSLFVPRSNKRFPVTCLPDHQKKPDFTLKLYCDQTEVTVQTDDLDVLQGLLRELRRSHLIARKTSPRALDAIFLN